MKTKFKDLLKGIFLTSVASLISSNEANAISYDLSRISDDNNIAIIPILLSKYYPKIKIITERIFTSKCKI